MRDSKVKLIKESILSKILRIVGVLCCLVGLFLVALSGDIQGIIIYGGLGIWIFCTGLEKKKRIKRFKDYIEVIARQSNGCVANIENIAMNMGISSDEAKEELMQFIDKKYFSKAYINHTTNRIVISQEPKMKKKELL